MRGLGPGLIGSAVEDRRDDEPEIAAYVHGHRGDGRPRRSRYAAPSASPGAAVRLPRCLPASVVVLLCLAIAACGRDGAHGKRDGKAGHADAPALEGHLRLLALPGFAEHGQTDPAADWIGDFERRTGCQVELDVADDEAQLLARLAAREADVAIVPGDQVLALVANGDVQALDAGRVPTLARVPASLRDGAWAMQDKARYAVPFVWRPLVLRYRADVFAVPPDAGVVFSAQPLPDRKPNADRVQLIDSPMAIAAAAAQLAVTAPELGIDDPFALDAQQYDAALAVLRAQRPLLHGFWRDTADQDASFAGDGVVAALGFPGTAHGASEADVIAWVAPPGDVLARVDASVLVAHAAHPHCGYAWLDASLDPRVQGAAAAWLGAVPANPAGCGVEPRLGDTGCRANGAELLPRTRFWRTPQAACRHAGGCIPYSRWTADFLALREQ
jgi:putative spermidine/putrescine transport system substrate-binding protein